MNDGAENGWTATTLGEVCQINPPKPKLAGLPDDTVVMFVPMAAVDQVTGTIVDPEQRALRDIKDKSYRTFQPNDVIFAKITPCMENGKAAIVPDFAAGIGFGSTEFHVLRPTSAVTAPFIWHYVRQERFRRIAAEHMSGSVGQLRVPATFLEGFPIAVPRKEEQDRLVRVLDAVMTSERSANQHLASARRAVKRFHDAVLESACSGRLTEDWHIRTCESGIVRTAENAQFDVPKGWEMTTLGDISARITSGSRDWSKYYGRGSGTFVMAQNVRRGYLDWSFHQPIDPPKGDASRDRSQIRRGDLLVTIVGANTGDVGPVTEDRPEHYVCQSVALVRPTDPDLTPYLNFWFNSPGHGRAYFEACLYGAGRPHLSFQQLKEAPVALPTPSEQTEIARRVDSLLRSALTLEARIDSASQRVSNVAQALLLKAFRGELVGNGA